MKTYVSFMNVIASVKEKHCTQALNMVSGVIDASFTV